MSNNNGLLSSTDVSATGDPQSNFFIRKREPLIVDIIIANEVITDEINLNTGILTTTGGGTILTLNGVPTGGGELDTLTAIAPLVITGTAADEIIAIAPSGVVAGTYTVSEITVNALGLITSAASGVVPPNDDWSAFPAQSNVNLNGFAIQNLQTPTNPQDGSTKGYTDALDAQNVKLTGAQSIGDVKNFLLPPTTNILPTTNNQLCNKLYVDSVLPGADPLSVVLTTGNSAGSNQIDMSSNKIINLLNPTNAQDAVTLDYINNLPPPSIPSLSQVLIAGNSAGGSDINMNGNDISSVNDITMSGLVPTITATNILGNLTITSAATMNLGTAGQMTLASGGILSLGGATYTTIENMRINNNVITKETGADIIINNVGTISNTETDININSSDSVNVQNFKFADQLLFSAPIPGTNKLIQMDPADPSIFLQGLDVSNEQDETLTLTNNQFLMNGSDAERNITMTLNTDTSGQSVQIRLQQSNTVSNLQTTNLSFNEFSPDSSANYGVSGFNISNAGGSIVANNQDISFTTTGVTGASSQFTPNYLLLRNSVIPVVTSGSVLTINNIGGATFNWFSTDLPASSTLNSLFTTNFRINGRYQIRFNGATGAFISNSLANSIITNRTDYTAPISVPAGAIAIMTILYDLNVNFISVQVFN